MKCTEPVPTPARRRDVDLDAMCHRFSEGFAELQNGEPLHGPPKSDALSSVLCGCG
jgi:hypothetical protein